VADNTPLANLPLVCVLWLDAHDGKAGEYTKTEILQDYHKPAIIRTFGLLLIDNEEGVTLVKEITSEDDEEGETTYRGRGFIPRGMVKELVNLGVPKRPRRRTPSSKKVPVPRVQEEVATSDNDATPNEN
jgi:hypothetical protein